MDNDRTNLAIVLCVGGVGAGGVLLATVFALRGADVPPGVLSIPTAALTLLAALWQLGRTGGGPQQPHQAPAAAIVSAVPTADPGQPGDPVRPEPPLKLYRTDGPDPKRGA